MIMSTWSVSNRPFRKALTSSSIEILSIPTFNNLIREGVRSRLEGTLLFIGTLDISKSEEGPSLDEFRAWRPFRITGKKN
jgi:hypothetical protein